MVISRFPIFSPMLRSVGSAIGRPPTRNPLKGFMPTQFLTIKRDVHSKTKHTLKTHTRLNKKNDFSTPIASEELIFLSKKIKPFSQKIFQALEDFEEDFDNLCNDAFDKYIDTLDTCFDKCFYTLDKFFEPNVKPKELQKKSNKENDFSAPVYPEELVSIYEFRKKINCF